ncbi:unnamed protein product [Discula destructiva]
MLIWAPIQLLLNLIRTLIAVLTRHLPIRPFIACAAIRMFLYTFTPSQIQLLLPPTLANYTAFIRRTRARARAAGNTALLEQLQEDIHPLPSDPRAHLLIVGDRTTATRWVYFLHGGGYVAPALRGHFEWALQAYVLGGDGGGGGDSTEEKKKKKKKEHHRVAVAVLQYTLAPSARFPEQMCQAISGLRYLFEEVGVRPGQLVIGGDSAGGNLTTQVLTHLLHPYPCAERVELSEPLAGAFLVSPLVSADTSARSFEEGWACDMLSVGFFNGAPRREMFHVPYGGWRGWLLPNWRLEESEAFQEGRRWAVVGDMEPEWLAGMGPMVRKVYVTCGRHEILRDQGIALAESMKAQNPDVSVKLEVAEQEAHDFILLEGERREVGDATVRMRNWFSRVWE